MPISPTFMSIRTIWKSLMGYHKENIQRGLNKARWLFLDTNEDVISMSLSSLSNLMRNYNVDYKDIGRLEVGTETILDKSKSIKSSLMQLFEASGNYDVEGADTINACYGGTNALINAINWVESPHYDGRLAVVVCGDEAIYEAGAARPTGGSGSIALLIGPNAPIRFEGIKGTCAKNAYDFYKPNLNSPFPVVDGKLSMSCYFEALDYSVERYKVNYKRKYGVDFNLDKDAKHLLFHSPFVKLVRKSFARMYYNEWIAGNLKHLPEFSNVDESLRNLPLEETYTNNNLFKTFSDLTNERFEQRVEPTLFINRNIGNSYTGSLYMSILSLLNDSNDQQLANERILCFSYGSGFISTLFSLKFDGSINKIKELTNTKQILNSRNKVDVSQYTNIMKEKEVERFSDFNPIPSVDKLQKGAYYLQNVDSLGRRVYNQK
eukprot:TRINITY_DN16970_c0_g1_i1.p1 TRINITY_DN16970_c0_g1~~TRINITY_DN16970_c0_g1_i1.p1  ORF type:complete len:435 (+),score=96.58 TRINITY_DN16970_c0_g1_i1:369-1673(+)